MRGKYFAPVWEVFSPASRTVFGESIDLHFPRDSEVGCWNCGEGAYEAGLVSGAWKSWIPLDVQVYRGLYMFSEWKYKAAKCICPALFMFMFLIPGKDFILCPNQKSYCISWNWKVLASPGFVLTRYIQFLGYWTWGGGTQWGFLLNGFFSSPSGAVILTGNCLASPNLWVQPLQHFRPTVNC